MKPQRAFTAAGIAANHCEALMGRRVGEDELLARLARMGGRLSRLLPTALAPFCGGQTPGVRMLDIERLSEQALAQRIGPLAGNAVLGNAAGSPAMLISVEALAVFAQLDRAFGGTGDIADTQPLAFPTSGILLLARIHAVVLRALNEALGPDNAMSLLASDSDYSVLEAFPGDAQLAVLVCEFTARDARPCELTLALPMAALERLFAASAAAQPRRAKIARGPLDAPFADMPLQLDARLVDMRLPLGRLAALKVGQVLPVSVARKVPLSIGGTVLAHGTLGEQDDRLALRVAETPLNPRPGSIPQANVQEVQA
ncbi:MAG: FliM/FliN family flagellar motor switch protein [Sphingomonadaceae bacterium]|nr:FliM/FliN family flagellar motor switch protein [Sphingomonadaceae bacterium]